MTHNATQYPPTPVSDGPRHPFSWAGVVAIVLPVLLIGMALGIGLVYVNPLTHNAALSSVSVPMFELPDCEYEDGNTDGLPCVWEDPDTERLFYVSSENYR